MSKATILSVDDDENLQFVVREYLESDGYKVLRAHDLKEFSAWMEQGSAIDIVLLDLVLKDGEGISLITTIRDKIKAPIIIVSGKTDTTEKIVSLEMGADDYNVFEKLPWVREAKIQSKMAQCFGCYCRRTSSVSSLGQPRVSQYFW